jgi:hypothetical protein
LPSVSRLNGSRPFISRFTGVEFERDRFQAATALLGFHAVPFVRQEMVEAGEQEGTEPPLRTVGFGELAPLEQAGEKRLGQVLGIRRRMTATPDKGVERIPVGAAQVRQGLPRVGGVAASRGRHQRPACRQERGVP